MKCIAFFVTLLSVAGCNSERPDPQFNNSPVPAGWTGTPSPEQKARTFQGRPVPEFPTMTEVLENEK